MNRYSISKHQIENSPTRTVGIIAFPGVEIIDIVGPMEVFTFANTRLLTDGIISDPVYEVKVLSKGDGPVTTLSGLQILPSDRYAGFCRELDTLIIPGGIDPESLADDTELMSWIRECSENVRRITSVCNGAFVLAEAGLLDGRRATTHWNYSDRFRKRYPRVKLEHDRIFIQDGPVWSSGGITSGIDLALAMVEDDWGHKLALAIARFMVVFLKRQGGQSQYSEYLKTDAASRHDIRELQAWIIENVQKELCVGMLAEQASMSARNFARVFRAETGVTPAKYIEIVRVDLARHYLESTRFNINTVAQKTGFNDPETLRKTFVRHIGITPMDYRARFGDIRGNGWQPGNGDAGSSEHNSPCRNQIMPGETREVSLKPDN